MSKSKGILPFRRGWTRYELEQLAHLYPDHKGEDVARALCRSVSAIYGKANQLGLRKSAAFLASELSSRIERGQQNPSMQASQFKPGLVPWNAGMKGLQYEGSKATQFKPGQQPHTWLPVGSVRMAWCGSSRTHQVLERKVNNLPGANHVRWHPVHRLVWIEAHGPVPEGSIVVFRPGLHTNVLEEITADRVECITRAENARRNHPRSKSPELGRLVQLKGAITRQVNRIVREHQERPQP